MPRRSGGRLLHLLAAAWRTCASVIPHPKLFQLFQPNGGVSAGLPGAAEAMEWAEAVTDTVAVSTMVARRRSSRPPDRLGTWCSFRGRAPWAGDATIDVTSMTLNRREMPGSKFRELFGN